MKTEVDVVVRIEVDGERPPNSDELSQIKDSTIRSVVLMANDVGITDSNEISCTPVWASVSAIDVVREET